MRSNVRRAIEIIGTSNENCSLKGKQSSLAENHGHGRVLDPLWYPKLNSGNSGIGMQALLTHSSLTELYRMHIWIYCTGYY